MQCHFFALGFDLVPVFDAVERVEPVHYVLFQHDRRQKPPTYTRGIELPTLATGIPLAPRNSGRQYLAAIRRLPFEPRPIGGGVYAFDQLANPHSIVLTHSVIAAEQVLVPGSVSTSTDHAASVQLQKRFVAAIRKGFVRVRAFWLGPEAHRAWQSGWRLTSDPGTSQEYDLVAQ